MCRPESLGEGFLLTARSAQAGWGNCGQAFMTNPTSDSPCGHCMRTCGRCNASS